MSERISRILICLITVIVAGLGLAQVRQDQGHKAVMAELAEIREKQTQAEHLVVMQHKLAMTGMQALGSLIGEQGGKRIINEPIPPSRLLLLQKLSEMQKEHLDEDNKAKDVLRKINSMDSGSQIEPASVQPSIRSDYEDFITKEKEKDKKTPKK